MYRHIIKSESKNKELNAKLDRLDKYFYDVLNLIPMHEMLNNNSEELAMASKMYKDTLAISNDFADLLIEEDEKLNMIDTKLDGLESMLKDIQEKLDK